MRLVRVTANESNYGPFTIFRSGENEWCASFRSDETIDYQTKHRSLNAAVSFIDSNLDKLKAKYPSKW